MNKRAQSIELPDGYIKRLDPMRPTANQIAICLEKAILEMRLIPGQIISETEVGALFGASRTPVRDAFFILREQGLIQTYPSRGSFVSHLSIDKLKGAQFVREALELRVIEEICQNPISKELSDELNQNIQAQRREVKRRNGTAFHKLDDQFHLLLAEAVGNSRPASVISREKLILDRLRVLNLDETEHLTVLLEDHEKVRDAILARDIELAQELMQEHLRHVLETLSNLVVQHRDYFDD